MRQLTGRRILVVEDEAIIALLMEQVLLDAGATVLGPAYSLADALAMLAANKPDAAVLDMNLNGFSAAPVADSFAARGIPFVVVTGYDKSAVPLRHAGMPVLDKPYDPDELVAVLVTLLSRHSRSTAAPLPDPSS